MKTKTFLAILFLIFIFSCESEQDKIKAEVNSFKEFSDSLLAVNKNYVEVLYGDTILMGDIKSDELQGLNLEDTVIALHSNIFDTFTEFTKTKMAKTLAKYNSLELKLDTMKSKMDEKTLKLFESIKQNINTIKQPVK
ncbi:MAG: hypothetical protein K9G64_08290 [Bacteroidia bacterium]|nr:hypothetical protein [Bacteroidia bacterium]